MFPNKRKKGYRNYLEPGNEFTVPRSTKRTKTSSDGDPKLSEDGETSSGGLSRQERGDALGDSISCDASVPLEHRSSTSDSEDSSSNGGDSVFQQGLSDEAENTEAQPNVACTSDVNQVIASPNFEGEHDQQVTQRSTVQQSEERSGGSEVREQLDLFVNNQTQSDPDDAAFSRGKINYVEKYELRKPIGPVTITKTKYEILVMIFHLVMRHGMTGKLVEDLLKFVNELLGREFFPVSKYLFNKIFEPAIPIQFHFYCEQCELYLGERDSFVAESVTEVTCPNCSKKCNVHNLNGTDFFVTLPLKTQLELLAKKPGIVLLPNERKSPPNVCDVTDGELFQALYDENDITITFNSDGAQAFHTGQYSLWPLQAYVNNLPPTERFRGENIFVCGLWFGKKSPNFHIFFKAFNRELRGLAQEGITINNVRRRVFASKCSVDSVARPKLQEHKQFNGRFGCGYCLHPGDVLASVTNNNVRYTARQQYPLRTDDGMRADMFRADELRKADELRRTNVDHVNGLKGLSCLLPLPKFAICRGVVIDYMHGMLLGNTCKIVSLMFEFKRECVRPGVTLSLVDERLLSLTPPKCLLVRPRPLSKFTDFKAKEFRALVLYYILPCTRDVLKVEYYNNLREFVSALFLLLKDNISPSELDEAERLLQSFVIGFNRLYGDVNMTYNIHLCTHLVQMVRSWGPLWCYSNFCFEAGNGNLLKLNEGTRGIVTQLAVKYCMARTIGESMSRHNVSAEVLDFCSEVVSIDYSKGTDFGSVRGYGEVINVATEEEKTLLSQAGLAAVKHLVYFNRAIREGAWYYSRAYTRPKVFDDSCVCLEDGRYARIWKIVRLPNSAELHVIVTPIRIAAVPHLAPHIKTCSANTFESMELRTFKEVKTKCAFLIVDSTSYVCDIANFYEVH